MFGRRGFWSGLLAGGFLGILGILAASMTTPRMGRMGAVHRVVGRTVRWQEGARHMADRVGDQVSGWLKH